MKKYILIALCFIFSSLCFANEEKYYFDEMANVSKIKLYSNQNNSFHYVEMHWMTKQDQVIVCKYKDFNSAKNYYDNAIKDSYDYYSLLENSYRKIQRTAEYSNTDWKFIHFQDNMTIWYKLIDYSNISIKESVKDSNFTEINFDNISESKKAALYNISILAIDKPNKNNVTYALAQKDDNFFCLKITPSNLRQFLIDNQTKSLNVFGSLVMESDSKYYFGVDKITKNQN